MAANPIESLPAGFKIDVSPPPVGFKLDVQSMPENHQAASVARMGGLTGRNIIEGMVSPIATVANLPAFLYNKGADVIQGEQGYRFPEQNQAVSNLLTKAGLPENETWQEKVSGFGMNAIGGMGSFNALIRGIPALSKTIPQVSKPTAPRGTIKNVADVFLPGGAKRMADAYTSEIVGGENLPNIVSAAQQAKQLVPGSQPTLAEAVSNLPEASPLLAHQQMVAKTPGGISGQFGQRIAEQQGARNALLAPIAKTPEALAQAEATRAANAATNYGDAYKVAIKGDKELLDILDNPYVKKAIPDAIDLAKANNVNPSSNLTQFLHYIKIGIDKQLTRTGDTSLASTEKEAAQSAKGKLIEWLGNRNPLYSKAREAFARESLGINKMELGQALQSKLVNPSGVETPGTYLRALEDAQKLIKTSTGSPMKLDKILTPEEISDVHKISYELERKLASLNPAQKTALAGGKNVAKDIGAALPSILSRPVVIANWLLKMATSGKGDVERHIDRIMAQRYLNPESFAEAMKQIPQTHRQVITNAIGEQAKSAAIVSIPQIAQQKQP